MPIILASKSDCTGCASCVDACPTNSIIYSSINSIFSYPHINPETCIHCGKCMRVCPADKPQKSLTYNQSFFYSWNTDYEERKKSTSGGVGTAIAKYAVENEFVVFGAGFVDNWILKTFDTTELTQINVFRGSKYLQSNMLGVYKSIKKHLSKERKVLFIGTPCQIAGVHEFIPETLSGNLYTCGILCHGVNSQIVWSDYRKFLENKYKSELVSYDFRCKSHGWQKRNGKPNLRVSYKFSNGVKVDEPAWKNLFHFWFGQHYMLRPSCLHCKYRTKERFADFTIGDFWGINSIVPNLNTTDGISVLIISTQKGEDFISANSYVHKVQVDSDKAASVLKGFVYSGIIDVDSQIKKVNDFENDYLNSEFEKMARKYSAPSFWDMVKASIMSRLDFK